MAKRGRPAKSRVDNVDNGIAGGVVELAGASDGSDGQINGVDSFDPASLGSASVGDSGAGAGSNGGDDRSSERKPRADRGRPRGPRKSAPLDLTDLKDIVVMAHAAAAIAFASPKLTLDEMEGEKLAGAIQKVLRHYDLPDVASETKDWIGLMLVCGSIYGPRMAAHWAEKNTAPPPPSAQEADNMVVFNPNPAMRS